MFDKFPYGSSQYCLAPGVVPLAVDDHEFAVVLPPACFKKLFQRTPCLVPAEAVEVEDRIGTAGQEEPPPFR
jgi:hypothetical protein